MKQDAELIREVGANTVRLAHYQHDEYFYDLCDEHGLVVWAEIPFISRFMEDGVTNTISQMKELVLQNINHPSIICWGISNEITLNGESEELYKNHDNLNKLCHELDPSRPTVMAYVSMMPVDSPMIRKSDIGAWNLYYGWYGGKPEQTARFLDEFHKKHPEIKVGLSEYGAEAVLKWQSGSPDIGDYSEQYQCLYHEKMLKDIMSRTYLWGTYVWNMFDFGSYARDEGGVKGRNNKGLVTFDRAIKKDSFYLYKAWWSKEGFVHIASRRYKDRAEAETLVKVYSNLTSVTLILNGVELNTLEGEHVFLFTVPLKMGENIIKAVSGSHYDEITINRTTKPNQDYILGISGAAANWFDEKGEMYSFDSPEGVYSVNDTIGDLYNNEKTAEILNETISPVIKAQSESNEGMGAMIDPEKSRSMMMGYTLRHMSRHFSSVLPPTELYNINKRLNEIAKAEKG